MKPDDKKSGLIAEAAPDASGATSPQNVIKHLKVPTEFNSNFAAGVKSVMQFVTNPTTHKYFLQALNGTGPASQKLAEGVEGLMKIIVHQSKGALKPQMYIPVGVYAISWVADYVRRAKLLPITDHDIAEAMQMFLHTTFQGLKAAQNSGGLLGGAQKPPGAPAAPGGPPDAAPPPQAPPGPQPGPAMPKMKAAPAQAPGSNPNLGPGAAPGPGSVPPPAMG